MQQLILPGIDFVPGKVRRHGLREFHHYPLASYGKNGAGIWLGSQRVPPELAWTYPELELGRTANSIPALIFDLDGPPTDWLFDVFSPALPVPNWMTFRRANQHAHLVYALARPVLRGEQARPTPQGWLARIGEYLAIKLQADAAYNAVLAHNPMSRASRGRYRTDWLRQEPYSLAELAGYIPKGWRRPRRPLTVYGRNDFLFRAGMKWTGRPRHWGDWAGLATYLANLNAEFVAPLGERELGGIVKSIRRIQSQNLQSGQTQRTFSFIQAARGRKGGWVSGAKRRADTLERDTAIVAAVQAGESMRSVERRLGLAHGTVRHIIKRGGE